MSDNIGGFPLTVTVPADDWAFTNRRLRYLEGVIVQILRDGGSVKEWYTAAELAALGLSGLPRSKRGIIRLATAHRWRRRVVTGRGGERYQFHCASLPDHAFHDLLDRIIALPGDDTPPEIPAVPARAREPDRPTNATPPWVLPLMRVLKAQTAPSLVKALDDLSQRLPPGIPCPTHEEAERVLRELGVVA